MLMIAQPVADALTGLEVQIITIGGGVLVTGIAALLTYGVVILKQKLNLDDKNQATQAVEKGFQNALNRGVDVLARKVAAGESVPDPKAVVTDAAVAYAAPKLGDELKRAGIDPATLPDRLDARAAGKLMEPAVTKALNTAADDAAKKANSGT